MMVIIKHLLFLLSTVIPTFSPLCNLLWRYCAATTEGECMKDSQTEREEGPTSSPPPLHLLLHLRSSEKRSWNLTPSSSTKQKAAERGAREETSEERGWDRVNGGERLSRGGFRLSTRPLCFLSLAPSPSAALAAAASRCGERTATQPRLRVS